MGVNLAKLEERIDALRAKFDKAFDPDQPRDNIGRWTDIGSLSATARRRHRLRPWIATEEDKARFEQALARQQLPKAQQAILAAAERRIERQEHKSHFLGLLRQKRATTFTQRDAEAMMRYVHASEVNTTLRVFGAEFGHVSADEVSPRTS